ncbi:MAG: AAA family ATPase [Anaerolineae bacterium]|nr:AAA family ATPase [Anaerolineae bacterium]
MQYFSRVKLRNWKNFQTVEVNLSERMFLVGPNASGKSNFLDVFRFLRDLAVPGGGLSRACEVRGGVSRLRSLHARTPPQIEIEIEISEENQRMWRYAIGITQEGRLPRQGTPRLTHEEVTNLQTTEETILRRPTPDDEQDPLRMTQTALEQSFFNREFRSVADFFGGVTYLHIVPQVVRNAGGLALSPEFPDDYGGRFIERIAKTPSRSRDARLNRILEALKSAVPQFERLELRTDTEGDQHLQASYRHWRATAAYQDETQMSDGTLRLIALLWALQEGHQPILLEEPELSLHAHLIRQIPKLLEKIQQKKSNNRQILISTHSYELLSDEGISGHETLMFAPTENGTTVTLASQKEEISNLLQQGLSVAEVVIPYTAPPELYQLPLW